MGVDVGTDFSSAVDWAVVSMGMFDWFVSVASGMAGTSVVVLVSGTVLAVVGSSVVTGVESVAAGSPVVTGVESVAAGSPVVTGVESVAVGTSVIGTSIVDIISVLGDSVTGASTATGVLEEGVDTSGLISSAHANWGNKTAIINKIALPQHNIE
jgi:hypothetical protein